MQIQNDPNVVYGGDPSEFGPLNGGFSSFGELIYKSLTKGGNETAFVRNFHKLFKIFIMNMFSRSMAQIIKLGLSKNFANKAPSYQKLFMEQESDRMTSFRSYQRIVTSLLQSRSALFVLMRLLLRLTSLILNVSSH